MDDWNIILDWIAKAVLCVIVSQGVKILSDMKKSVDKLNVQVGTIIERTEWHSKEIDRLDTRMNRLEVRGHSKGSVLTTPRKDP